MLYALRVWWSISTSILFVYLFINVPICLSLNKKGRVWWVDFGVMEWGVMCAATTATVGVVETAPLRELSSEVVFVVYV